MSPRRGGPGLLVADEAHRYGAPTWGEALRDAFVMRLALTATYERNDDGLVEVLGPYFGGVVMQYGYADAARDGVIAPLRIALVGTALDEMERRDHDEADRAARRARQRLVGDHRLPRHPLETIRAAVAIIAEADSGARRRDDPAAIACREYLVRLRARRDVAAQAAGKLTVAASLAPALVGRRTLVFCDTVDQAELAAKAIVGAGGPLTETLHGDLPTERRRITWPSSATATSVLVAPRVLDEGVDVPDADIAVVLAAGPPPDGPAGRTRAARQGRRMANLVVVHAVDTLEDPDNGAHEDFLDDVAAVATEITGIDADGAPDGVRTGSDRDAARSAVTTSGPSVWSHGYDPSRSQRVRSPAVDGRRDPPLLDVLEMLAPGTSMRDGIERIIGAGRGALMVIGYGPEVEALVSGGFTIDTPATAQRIAELAKMDGGIILDDSAERIIRANVHLVPDPGVTTSETGTRHRSAERTAKQTGRPVLSVSESMQRVTLYWGQRKHVLEPVSSLLFRANQALSTLERYRARLDEVANTLTQREIDDAVVLRDAVLMVQRSEMMRRIAAEIEDLVAELGSEGRLIRLQLDELLSAVEDERVWVVQDYLADRRRKVENVLASLDELSTDDLLDLGLIAEVLAHRRLARPRDPACAPPTASRACRPRSWTSSSRGSVASIIEADIDDLDNTEASVPPAPARSTTASAPGVIRFFVRSDGERVLRVLRSERRSRGRSAGCADASSPRAAPSVPF